MPGQTRRISGSVLRVLVAAGSKSERIAVVLRTESGRQYILRRAGGNAYRDQVLEKLVGATIFGHGLVLGETFVLNSWTVEDNHD
jgi:hypothetical protein